MRSLALLTLLATALLTSSSAWAQSQPSSDLVYTRQRAAEPPASAWDVSGLRGIEVQASGGVAYGGGNSPVRAPNVYGGAFPDINPAGTILNPAGAPPGQGFSPYSYDPFGFAFSAGYRRFPSWSFGGFFSYANYSSNDVDPNTGDQPDGSGGLERVRWAIGLYARYYLTTLSSRLQPWAQVGIGYVNDSASYAHPGPELLLGGGPDNLNYLLHYHGLTIPVALGLDWRLAPAFAVGPFVTYEQAVPINGCVEITVDETVGSVGPVSTCDRSVVETHSYGSVFAGIFGKLTFGR
jgi:opacity protein-like surface antigen